MLSRPWIRTIFYLWRLTPEGINGTVFRTVDAYDSKRPALEQSMYNSLISSWLRGLSTDSRKSHSVSSDRHTLLPCEANNHYLVHHLRTSKQSDEQIRIFETIFEIL